MSNLSMKLALAAAAVAALGAPTAHASTPPEGRGYELITPQGVDGKMARSGAAVSDDGNRLTFAWSAALPQSEDGYTLDTDYSALRGPAGWSVSQLAGIGAGLAPPQLGFLDVNTQAGAFVLGTSTHAGGLWVRKPDGTLDQWVAAPEKAGFPIEGWTLAGASNDLSRVYLRSTHSLAPGALPSQVNVYEVTQSGLTLVSTRPDGTPAPMTVGSNATDPFMPDAVSRDGRTVVLTEITGQLHVYVHVEGTPTIDASASQLAAPHTHLAAHFDGMSDDGRYVVFRSAEQLTTDAQTGGDTTEDLYRYDVHDGTLRALTTGFADPPDVQGIVAISRDARRGYYVAKAALSGSDAVDGQSNLYRFDADSGTTAFIATLSSDDSFLWQPFNRYTNAHITDDGRFLAFLSRAPITGPENVGPDNTPHVEVYVYDDDTGVISCASCGPRGTHSSHGAVFGVNPLGAMRDDIPDLLSYGTGNPVLTRARSMSADGRRVFFVTRDPLVPADRNGNLDVYLYEDGHAQLISPGDGPYDAVFEGSSASGDDAVFATAEPLVGADRDGAPDLYDARVGGGFPEPAGPVVAPCSGDACQGPPAPSVTVPQPASIAFEGPATTDQPRVSAPTSGSVRHVKLAVVGRSVRGATLTLSIRTPGAGRLSVTGSKVRAVRRTARRAATYKVRVSLNAAARRAVARRGHLRVSLRVGVVPKAGKASSTTVAVTVKG